MGTAEMQGRLWGSAAADWAELQEPTGRPAWEAALAGLHVGPGCRFLDAGCGGGGAASLAAARGATVAGIDASDALIAVAAARLPGADLQVGDLEALPFATGSFDAILAANSIQYVGDRPAVLREFFRVCAPGGRMAVIVWSLPERCEQREVFRAVLQALPAPPPGEGPFALSPPGILESLIEGAGFRVLESREVDCPFDYPDLGTAWRAQRSPGPLSGALAAVGEDILRSAVTDVLRSFMQADGRVHLANAFRCVVGAKDA